MRNLAREYYSNSQFLKFRGSLGQQYENFAYLLSYGLSKNDGRNFSLKLDSERPIPSKLRETISQRNDLYIKQLTKSSNPSILIKIKSTSPYISGMGAPHVTETGLKLHQTYGVPYIDATALKGLMRSWSKEAGVEHKQAEYLFGVSDKNVDDQASVIMFHDVLFDNLSIKSDIITPHKFDGSGNLKTTPIPFPTVMFNSEGNLIISLSPRANSDSVNLEEIANWVIIALDEYGLGAKTALGYGRFEGKIESNYFEQAQATHKEEQSQLLASRREAEMFAELTEEEKAIHEMLNLIKKAETDKHILDNTVKQLEFIEENAENAEVIQALVQLYKKLGIYKKPNPNMKPRVNRLKEIVSELRLEVN